MKFRPKTKMAVRKYQTFSVTQVGGKSEQIKELKKILIHYGPFTTSVKVGLQQAEWSAYKGGILKGDKDNCVLSA